MKSMLDLIICLRALNLYYHAAHNNTSGPSFHSDHAFFGSAYEEVDDQYDACIERLIGNLGRAPALLQIVGAAAKKLKDMGDPVSVDAMYKAAIKEEKYIADLCSKVDKECADSVGVKNLVGDIADKCEQRQYKISRRSAS